MAAKILLRKSFFMSLLVLSFFLATVSVHAETGTDFTGTVLSADAPAGKFAVKKEGSGTRFTFTVNDKTQFSGGPKNLGDLKKGDSVTVIYSTVGSQYIAQTVTRGK